MNQSLFKNLVVQKKWGNEREVFYNGTISLWLLQIHPGHSTSMHAHMNKRTGLVMVGGLATLSFMYQSHRIEPLDKYNIHPRSFHKTVAHKFTTLLEVEAPPNKTDLVRMADDYGRAGMPYEAGPYEPKSPSFRDLESHGQHVRFDECLVDYDWFRDDHANDNNDVLIIASGGLITPEQVQIVYPGDILWSSQLKKLLSMAEAIPLTEVIRVVKIGGPKL